MDGDELTLDMGAASDEISSGLGFEIDNGGDDAGDPNLDLGNPAGGGGNQLADPVEVAAEVKPAEGAVTDPAAVVTTNEPPKTWRKEAAAAWATIPPAAQAEILKREDDIFKGIEGYKADATFGKSMNAALAPFMQTMQQYNIDPAAHVGALMQAHHTLALGNPQQKLALFQQLAKDYQVDLGQLSPDYEPPYIDPAVKDLQSQLQAVQSQLSNAERTRATETRQVFEKQVETFAKDPANPHFEEVASDMAMLLEKGICKTLPEAYERAVWSNPAVRAKEVTRQQTEASQKAAADAATKAATARKATAANVRTSAKSGSAAAPLGSMDDTLNETLAAIRARG